MKTKFSLTVASVLFVAFAATSAQAGSYYHGDDYDSYRPAHRVHVYHDVEVVTRHHEYYQKKVLVGQRPTFQTCHVETRWSADGYKLPVETCN